MKCERCHQADATTAVTVKKDGAEKELYVCAACAAAIRNGGRKKKTSADSSKSTVIKTSGEEPPPFVEELVKATLGFMKGVAEAEENERRVCPVCHAKWDKLKEAGRLGCPACWRTFARQIRREFLSAEFGRAHIGAAPAIDRLPDARSVRAVLERDLKAAIAREDFHRAAALKRQLDALDHGTESAS